MAAFIICFIEEGNGGQCSQVVAIFFLLVDTYNILRQAVNVVFRFAVRVYM